MIKSIYNLISYQPHADQQQEQTLRVRFGKKWIESVGVALLSCGPLGGPRKLKYVSKSNNYTKEDAMNHMRLLQQMMGLALGLLLLVAM